MKRLIAALLLLAACSSEKPAIADAEGKPAQPSTPPAPSTQQARDIVAASTEFGEYEFTNASVTLPVSGAAMNEPARATAKELQAAGWVTLDTNGDLALTEKGRNDKRFLLRPNGLLDVVPLAKKEFGEVTAVRPNPDNTVFVDFTWRWIANEVGAALRTGLAADRFATPQDGRATLTWDGATWVILKIE